MTIIIILLIPVFFIAIPDMDITRLSPVLAEGVMPILKGAVVPSAWMSQVFFLGWFLQHANKITQSIRKDMFAVIVGIVALIIGIDIITISIFGPVTARLKFAFLEVIQYIGIRGSLERIEAIAIAIRALGIFIKVSMLLYMFTISTAQLAGAKNYRKIIVPVTLLSVVGSVWIFKNSTQFQAWITFTYPILAFVTQSMLPLLLLAIDHAKAKMQH